MKLTKKQKETNKKIDVAVEYSLTDAVSKLKQAKPAKFDESVDVAVRLGVDPKHADQVVRGTVSLPNGTGKQSECL